MGVNKVRINLSGEWRKKVNWNVSSGWNKNKEKETSFLRFAFVRRGFKEVELLRKQFDEKWCEDELFFVTKDWTNWN